MAKKDKETFEDDFVAIRPDIKKAPPAINSGKSSPTDRMNFDKYARKKGFRASHIPGLKAFAKNTNILRTQAEWDSFFEKY